MHVMDIFSYVICWKNVRNHFSWTCLSNTFDASLTLLNFNDYGSRARASFHQYISISVYIRNNDPF